MRYELCDIEKIVEFTTWSDRRKLDELLRIDCSQYTNLGCDSTKLEREQVKRNSRKIILKKMLQISNTGSNKFFRIYFDRNILSNTFYTVKNIN